MGYGTIGKLDRRITIQSPNRTRGLGGSPEELTWISVATVWSSFSPETGSDSFVDDERRNRARATFGIRKIDGLTTEMRIQFDGQYWDIISLSATERNRSIDIVAEILNYEPHSS